MRTTRTNALDDVEAWVHREIDKLSVRTMVGDRAIGVDDAEQIAMVAAHRVMEIAQAAGEQTRMRTRLACHVVGHLASAMLMQGWTIEGVHRDAPDAALALVDSILGDDS